MILTCIHPLPWRQDQLVLWPRKNTPREWEEKLCKKKKFALVKRRFQHWKKREGCLTAR